MSRIKAGSSVLIVLPRRYTIDIYYDIYISSLPTFPPGFRRFDELWWNTHKLLASMHIYMLVNTIHVSKWCFNWCILLLLFPWIYYTFSVVVDKQISYHY